MVAPIPSAPLTSPFYTALLNTRLHLPKLSDLAPAILTAHNGIDWKMWAQVRENGLNQQFMATDYSTALGLGNKVDTWL